MRTMWKSAPRWVRDPLTHFLVIGLAAFALFGAFGKGEQVGSRDIYVTRAELRHLSIGFAQVHGRVPDARELKGLIDDFVREEIAYREAMALGLDRDDIVVRRRLRQKFEFLNEDVGADLPPGDAQLSAFLRQHAGEFSSGNRVEFEQIFIDPQKVGDPQGRAVALLKQLHSTRATRPSAVRGDPISIERDQPFSEQSEIARKFGAPFAERIVALPLHVWTGPIASGYGLHLVYVTRTDPGHPFALAEVRELVTQRYLSDRRERRVAARYAELLRRYRVTIEPGT